jgi:sulfite exporter TauE/SafE
VWNGLFVGWTLPALGLHYVALLSLIQVMFLAGGAFLICLGLAIFVAKQKMEIAE